MQEDKNYDEMYRKLSEKFKKLKENEFIPIIMFRQLYRILEVTDHTITIVSTSAIIYQNDKGEMNYDISTLVKIGMDSFNMYQVLTQGISNEIYKFEYAIIPRDDSITHKNDTPHIITLYVSNNKKQNKK